MGYTGDFSSLYLEPEQVTLGVRAEDEKTPCDGMTRAQAAAFLQKKILADVRAGKPPPMVEGAGAAAAGAPNRPGSAPPDMPTAAGEPGDGKPRLAGAKPGEQAGQGGGGGAAGRGDRTAAAPQPGLAHPCP